MAPSIPNCPSQKRGLEREPKMEQVHRNRENAKIWLKKMQKWSISAVFLGKSKFHSPRPRLSCKVPKHMTPLKRCRRSASNFRFTVNVVIQLWNLHFWTRRDFRIRTRLNSFFYDNVFSGSYSNYCMYSLETRLSLKLHLFYNDRSKFHGAAITRSWEKSVLDFESKSSEKVMIGDLKKNSARGIWVV